MIVLVDLVINRYKVWYIVINGNGSAIDVDSLEFLAKEKFSFNDYKIFQETQVVSTNKGDNYHLVGSLDIRKRLSGV